MNRPTSAHETVEPSTHPSDGWHCLHIYYAFDRLRLGEIEPANLDEGIEAFQRTLDPSREESPARLQVGLVSGHRADFSLMLMDSDPLVIDRVHQHLLSSSIGTALIPTYSYASISEISEYVMTVEQYGEKLIRDGETKGSPTYEAKLNGYSQRLPIMNRERLTPEFPEWPVSCFYPMNKKRDVGANWFMLPYSKRSELMGEHARSGMKYVGKVKQLITVGVGIDDWEWGVTLWAANPEHLIDIVYNMRFDEASARYAEFGPFYTSYRSDARSVLEHCGVLESNP